MWPSMEKFSWMPPWAIKNYSSVKMKSEKRGSLLTPSLQAGEKMLFPLPCIRLTLMKLCVKGNPCPLPRLGNKRIFYFARSTSVVKYANEKRNRDCWPWENGRKHGAEDD